MGRVVVGAQKEGTRRATFALFCLLTALQGLVAYDLYSLLDSFGLDFEKVVLIVFGYVLVRVFFFVLLLISPIISPIISLALKCFYFLFFSKVALFYLLVFYTSLLGKVFLLNDLDLVEHIRTNSYIEFRNRLHLLSTKHYAKFFVAAFLIVLLVEGTACGFIIYSAGLLLYFVPWF